MKGVRLVVTVFPATGDKPIRVYRALRPWALGCPRLLRARYLPRVMISRKTGGG